MITEYPNVDISFNQGYGRAVSRVFKVDEQGKEGYYAIKETKSRIRFFIKKANGKYSETSEVPKTLIEHVFDNYQ